MSFFDDADDCQLGVAAITKERGAGHMQRQLSVQTRRRHLRDSDPESAQAPPVPGQEMNVSVQLLGHESATSFMRFPTPAREQDDDANAHTLQMAESTDLLIDDAHAYTDVRKSDQFQWTQSLIPCIRKAQTQPQPQGRADLQHTTVADPLVKKPTQNMVVLKAAQKRNGSSRMTHPNLQQSSQMYSLCCFIRLGSVGCETQFDDG